MEIGTRLEFTNGGFTRYMVIYVVFLRFFKGHLQQAQKVILIVFW